MIRQQIRRSRRRRSPEGCAAPRPSLPPVADTRHRASNTRRETTIMVILTSTTILLFVNSNYYKFRHSLRCITLIISYIFLEVNWSNKAIKGWKRLKKLELYRENISLSYWNSADILTVVFLCRSNCINYVDISKFSNGMS